MFEKVIAWGKQHPYMLGGIVFGVGLLLLWWFGFFSKSAPAQSTGVADYYAAQTAGAVAAGNLAQSNNATEAAIAGTNAGRDVSLAQTEAARQIGLAQTATAGQVSLGTAAITAEVADAQTAMQLATGMHYIDYLTNASRDATTAHLSDNAAAVTTSEQAAQVAQQRIIADVFGTYTAGNVAVDTAALAVDAAAIAQVPAYAAQFVAGGYSPDYASYDLANLFGTNSQGVQEITIQHENSNERAAMSTILGRLFASPTLNLQTVPMSNGPTSYIIPPVAQTPIANNMAAENQVKIAATTYSPPPLQPAPAPTVGYFGKG